MRIWGLNGVVCFKLYLIIVGTILGCVLETLPITIPIRIGIDFLIL